MQPHSQLKKPAVRCNVVCECSTCKCVRYVSQGERQRHLKRDQDARLRRIQQDALTSVSSTSMNPVPPSALLNPAAMEVDSPSFAEETALGHTLPQVLDDPVEDHQMQDVGGPSPPRSPIIPVTAPTMPRFDDPFQQPQEHEGFGMPDDWEDADPADEEDLRTVPPAVVDGFEAHAAPDASSITEAPAATPGASNTTNATPLSTDHARPVAWGVPLCKSEENVPDPFEVVTPRVATRSRQVIETPTTGMDLLYVLATWLHAQFRLPFRACAALIKVVILIIKFYGVVLTNDPISTLPRIMSKIDVEPTIHLLPICPSCLEVYPAKASTPSVCVRCNSNMFKTKPSTSASNKQEKRTPLLSFPYKSIQSSLEDILAVPGAEEELDKWRKVERCPGRYTDIFDGAVTRSLKCPDGSLFFRNGPGDEKGPNGVLRIGVNLGVDWYDISNLACVSLSNIFLLRFSYHRSQIAPSYSSCPMSFNIANFPPHLRYVRTAHIQNAAKVAKQIPNL